jgi:hypothetical protein
MKELDRDVTIEEVAPILLEKLEKYLKVPIPKLTHGYEKVEI